jgi:hypothetical protein
LSATVPAIFLLAATPFRAAQLSHAADRAFREYVVTLEKRLANQHATTTGFLAVLEKPPRERDAAERQLRSGVVLVEPVNGGMQRVDGAMLHHWRAAALVPAAKAADMLVLLRDYSELPKHYAPEIQQCKVLAQEGDVTRLAIRLKEQKVIAVVMDAEYEVTTRLIGQTRGYEIARSTDIWEVDEPGTPHERRRPEWNDDGFLWRLNSYWSFLEVQGGLLMECEAVSLTRDTPTGLGWLITPLITELPRESLEFTLTATKKALLANLKKETNR